MFEKYRLGRVIKKMSKLRWDQDSEEFRALQDQQVTFLARMAARNARKRAKKNFRKRG